MSSSNDSNMTDDRGAPACAGHEALIARARELIADPGYPTAAIVEELAQMMTHHAGVPAGN